MSRVGKQAIVISAGTTVTISDGVVAVKGKGGELRRAIPRHVKVTVANNEVQVEAVGDEQLARALWGTIAAHIRNMIAGVNKPFTKQLVLEGVGYKVNLVGTKLVCAVGKSHPVDVPVPAGLTVAAEKNTVNISGADKELVGQFAANLRGILPPEPYQGKGFRYTAPVAEVIRRKQGKKAAASA